MELKKAQQTLRAALHYLNPFTLNPQNWRVFFTFKPLDTRYKAATGYMEVQATNKDHARLLAEVEAKNGTLVQTPKDLHGHWVFEPHAIPPAERIQLKWFKKKDSNER